MTRPEDMTDEDLRAELDSTLDRLEHDPTADNRLDAQRAAHISYELAKRGGTA
jgi:hypothetical protein